MQHEYELTFFISKKDYYTHELQYSILTKRLRIEIKELTTYQSLTQAAPSLSLHVCTCWLACGTGTCITVNASSRLPVPSVSLSPTADVAGALARSLLLAVSKAAQRDLQEKFPIVRTMTTGRRNRGGRGRGTGAGDGGRPLLPRSRPRSVRHPASRFGL